MMVPRTLVMTRFLRMSRVVAMLAVVLVFLVPRQASGQVVSSSLGFLGGVVAGTHMSMGAYVLKSRLTGWNFHSVDEILSPQFETLPIIIAPIAGVVLGASSPGKLGAAATWGGVGLVSGAAVGATVGHFIWGDTQGRWAGGTIGSAAGLLIGSVLGAALKSDGSDDEAESAARPLFITVSIPVGGF